MYNTVEQNKYFKNCNCTYTSTGTLIDSGWTFTSSNNNGYLISYIASNCEDLYLIVKKK